MPFTFYSAVLIPPNLAEMQLMSLKRRVFYSSAVVSSWALRPVVPVIISEKSFSLPERSQLPAVSTDGFRVDRLKKLSGHLVLGSDALDEISAKLAECLVPPGGDGGYFGKQPGFPGNVRGIHLADTSEEKFSEAEKVFESGFSELPETARLWKSLSAAVLKVSLTDERTWWKGIETELLERISLPRAGKPR